MSARPDGTIVSNDALLALSVEAARRGNTTGLTALDAARAMGAPDAAALLDS